MQSNGQWEAIEKDLRIRRLGRSGVEASSVALPSKEGRDTLPALQALQMKRIQLHYLGFKPFTQVYDARF
jgi:hypothetical protein